ncbi:MULTISPECIES: hypothetical protein [unclassified Leptolyngbya]|uniref:hypothetical protein n=1 Tax=unclassified Leptolyngbya TaxID=2650499 RepID=UPI001682040A|nr:MULTISPECIES: hypothetical protein [unclassified Leptolyngbya]MBD1910733.1 hypothetical protein [Leptolyngbya sp. FACHB-8]MBD2158168.1 hypothetical protein [Leptolyngbya sp. FACHB-16]
MTASAFDTLSHCTLRYKITQHDDGLILYVWEPATLTEARVRPFTFMAKHPIGDKEMAMEILSQYLSTYEG